MQYHAKVEHQGRQWTAVFVDAPGCATCASSRDKVVAAAREALQGWLEAHLVDGRAPPRPAPSARGTVAVEVDPQVAVAIALRGARQEAGLMHGQLAFRIAAAATALFSLSACGSQDCLLAASSGAFSVTLESASPALPDDLEIRLTCGPATVEASLQQMPNTDTAKAVDGYCDVGPYGCNADAGPGACTSVSCRWCMDAPAGTTGVFGAQAAGFQSLQVDFVSSGFEGECNYLSTQHLDVTLLPT